MSRATFDPDPESTPPAEPAVSAEPAGIELEPIIELPPYPEPEPPPPPPPMRPVGLDDRRIDELDIIRGFALFGILLVNIAWFSEPLYSHWSKWTDFESQRIDRLIDLLANGKFMSTFSFLFGVGFAIQMERAEARGASFVRFFSRRLMILLGIGILHAVFLSFVDILIYYALLGFLLLATRKAPIWTLLAGAVGMLCLPPMLVGMRPAYERWIDGLFESTLEASYLAFGRTEASYVYAHGTWGDIFRQRLHDLGHISLSGLTYMIPLTAAMFLIGAAAGRAGFFRKIRRHGLVLMLLFAVCLVLGIAGNLLNSFPELMELALEKAGRTQVMREELGVYFYCNAAFSVGAPALSLAYILGLTAMAREPLLRALMMPLAAMGRMALTNYILQSVAMNLVFYSYGLGWYGRTTPAECVKIVCFVYLSQIPFSMVWLAVFRFGPLEWIWRSLAYGKLQPFLRRGEAPAEA